MAHKAAACTSSVLQTLVFAAGSAAASPILVHNDHTLTDYRAAATSVQGVSPLVSQRGQMLDGSGRAGSMVPFAITANPGEPGFGGRTSVGVDLVTGAPVVSEVDLSLPGEGFRWSVGRTFSSVQDNGSHLDSNGYQGRNWFQSSQPELVLYEHASDDAEDVLYLVYGADRFAEFKRVSATSALYQGVNGSNGVIEHSADATSEPDTYVLYDSRGLEFTFFGFDGDAGSAAGSIWKVEDPAGNIAYAGDSATASTAITNGYSAGRIHKVVDTSGRLWEYTYSTIDSVSRLTKVEAKTKAGGGWFGTPTGVAVVAKVEYGYYESTDPSGERAFGDDGNLQQVTVTLPLTDSGVDHVKTKHYRYWKGTFDDTNNPGHPYALSYILDYEGARSYDWSDSNFNDSFLTATESSVKPYSAAYFEYDSSRRVDKTWRNGECGCSGAANGEHTIEYEANTGFSGGSGYDTAWRSRAVVGRPDGSYLTHYLDEVGQPLSRVISDGDPDSASDFWITQVTRGSDGTVTEIATPAANSSYTHTPVGSVAFTQNGSAGLIRTFERESGSVHTKHFVTGVTWQIGSSGTAYYDAASAYAGDSDADTFKATIGSGGDTTVLYRPNLTERYQYPSATTTKADSSREEIEIAQTPATNALHAEKGVSEPDAVATGNNGSGSDNETNHAFNADATLAFVKDPDGHIAYNTYTNGQVTTQVEDADTSLNGAGQTFNGVTIPTGFASDGSGDEFHRVTTHEYDAQGRRTRTTRYEGSSGEITSRVYYSALQDRRLVTISIPREWDDMGTTTFDGPATYTVTNHAGNAEFSATVALAGGSSTTALTSWIDEADDDPITALDHGSLFRVSAIVHDDAGTQMTESRVYFDIPTTYPGTEGTHYDAAFMLYDNMGRQVASKSPAGTISHTLFDGIGRQASSWIGTNDNSGTFSTKFDSSGTSDMVKVSEVVYDAGLDGGNGLVTKSTAFVQDSTTNKRETTFAYDTRGRRVLTTNPQAPHQFVKLDNMGRTVAVGMFSSTASITVSSDDPTTETTNRVALSETKYDEAGRVYERTRHEITPSTGASANSTTFEYWYDEEGRLVHSIEDNARKFTFDRLGRPIKAVLVGRKKGLATYNPSYNDATSYGSADYPVEESQTVYDPDTDEVLMRATIGRHYDTPDTGGALDSNADNDDLLITASNLGGRAQITAMWYDDLGRLTDTVNYGTYGGSNFDRDGLSVPARSDTALRTSFVYNDDGTRKSVTDAEGTETRYTYDDAGRQTLVVSNYVNGTPSGANADDDHHVRYEYTDGLQAKMWVDIDGDGTEDSDDQVTEYDYGVTKGASAGDSKIGSGDLLAEVTYPDSTGSTDTVTYAYNAQGQQVYMEDQAGNVIETEHDTAGRPTARKVTTLASGFDGTVRRIETGYDSSGRAETITSYDAATSGSIVNEVKHTFDGWGMLETYEKDRNSAVTAMGDHYDLDYSYNAPDQQLAKGVRLQYVDYPDGTRLSYKYQEFYDGNNVLDWSLNRVTNLNYDSTAIADYLYTGLGQVIETSLPEPDVEYQRSGSATSSYDNLDRFNRVTTDAWFKDNTTDLYFYDVDLSYDRSSNVTDATDNILGGRDYKYTMDDLNRLTQADRGTLSGGSITSATQLESWVLSQTGNWSTHKLDLDGDANYNETINGDAELWDHGTFSTANELTARDVDNDSTDEYTLTYDAVGNLTDDGEHYDYVYDAFGRLIEVKDRSNSNIVTRYRYYGNGHRASTVNDSDADGSLADETVTYLFHDPRWRLFATFEGSDTDPTEQIVYHDAGLAGRGTASYIDSVVLRDRDTDGNGSLDERLYLVQNWRADMVALLSDVGEQRGMTRYDPYGVPFAYKPGDVDGDYDFDVDDIDALVIAYNASSYDVLYDEDLDGTFDTADITAFGTASGSGSHGRGEVSTYQVLHGYAGYIYEPDLASAKWHVRRRVLDCGIVQWLNRDPIRAEYPKSFYSNSVINPIIVTDPMGLSAQPTGGTATFSEGQCIACRPKLVSVPADYSYSSRLEGTGVDIYIPWVGTATLHIFFQAVATDTSYIVTTIASIKIRPLGATGPGLYAWLGIFPIVPEPVTVNPSWNVSCVVGHDDAVGLNITGPVGPTKIGNKLSAAVSWSKTPFSLGHPSGQVNVTGIAAYKSKGPAISIGVSDDLGVDYTVETDAYIAISHGASWICECWSINEFDPNCRQ